MYAYVYCICISDEFFWMNDYKKLGLCFTKGSFCVADFICGAWYRRQSSLFAM